MQIKPYKESSSKKDQIKSMFDRISGNYDQLNRILSGGIDQSWRKKAINKIRSINPKVILDVATGTGDLAIMTNKMLDPDKIVGLDLSPGMLEVGIKKIAKLNLANKIEMVEGDSENLPFEDNSFDAATVGFGVRNFENLEKGINEVYRVLRPGGKFVILEFTKPRAFIIKDLFKLYFKYILPKVGGLLSGDGAAYKYLFDSVQAFPEYEEFVTLMKNQGFKKVSYKPLSLGICCIYIGEK